MGNCLGNGGGDKAILRKAVIGGNIAFRIEWGDEEPTSGSNSRNHSGNHFGNHLGNGGGDKTILRKVVIGGNVVWGANQSGFNSGNHLGIFLGNCLGNRSGNQCQPF